ncbi:sulfotransferase [soil metagenome]
MEIIIPNFLVGGPPKCASTSLNFYLKQHPEIFMSPVKQTRFFSVYYDKGPQYYIDTYFSEVTNEKMVGEATPTYFLLPFVPARIKAFNPGMKIIFCLRNPVERTFSGWSMRANNGTEHLSFIESLKENVKQRETVKFECDKDAAEWAADMLRGDRQDETGFRTYLDGSLYATNLRHYLKYFPASQIKVVFMDNLQKDLHGTLKEIFTFLGVDPSFQIQNTEPKNTYKKSKFKFLEPILGKNKPLSKMLSGLMPKSLKKKVMDTMYVEGSKKKLTPEDRKFAYGILKDEIADLEKMLNVDLSYWKVS